jgi:hypothetical protein
MGIFSEELGARIAAPAMLLAILSEANIMSASRAVSSVVERLVYTQ